MPTMTTCQTMARKVGSDQLSRIPRLGAVRAATRRGSAVAPDMVLTMATRGPAPVSGRDDASDVLRYCGHAIGRRNRAALSAMQHDRETKRAARLPERPASARPGLVPIRLDQRIGGAYCRPPLFHRLLMPRGTPSGVTSRSHSSPKLPTCLTML